MIKIAIYPSNHGFGHASRMAALAEELTKLNVHCIICGNRPQFLYQNVDPHWCEFRECSLDFGVKHTLNLVPDLPATKEYLLQLMNQRVELVEAEVAFLRAEQIDLVLADIPFLIMEACVYAEVPVYAISNFDWVFIYHNLFKADKHLKPVINTIFGLYCLASLSYRLPMGCSKSMPAFDSPQKLGLLARAKKEYRNIRQQYKLGDESILLSMFGGEGTPEYDIEALCKGFAGTVISTTNSVKASNHLKVEASDDFLDIIHGADLIITKPGYSSFAEAVQFGKPIFYFERCNYPEEKVLVQGLKHYQAKVKLESLQLSPKQWHKTLASMKVPVKPDRAFTNQNSKIAQSILAQYINSRYGKSLNSVIDMGTNNLSYLIYHKDQPIHSLSNATGLGKGITNSRIIPQRIMSTKSILKELKDFNKAVAQKTDFLGTGIFRETTNTAAMINWIKKSFEADFQIISPEQEIHYNELAIKAQAPHIHSYIGMDIGGSSTEIIISNAQSKSIPTGLLKLIQTHKDIDSATEAFEAELRGLFDDDYRGHQAVMIGLAGMYLALIIKKAMHPHKLPDLVKIHIEELKNLEQAFAAKELTEISPYLIEPLNIDVLSLSIRLLLLMLDKIGATDFLVCKRGIALGFIYEQKRNKDKRNKHRTR